MDHHGRTPQLHSQHTLQRACIDPPYLGRDPLDRGCAIFTIVESLKQLGLEDKTSVLLRWLGRFDGLEQHQEDENDPILCVRQVALGHVADHAHVARTPLPQREKVWHSLVMQILSQPFVHTCGDWSSDGLTARIRWSPMEQSFMNFLALGQDDEELSIWNPTQPNAARAQQFCKLLLQEDAR